MRLADLEIGHLCSRHAQNFFPFLIMKSANQISKGTKAAQEAPCSGACTAGLLRLAKVGRFDFRRIANSKH
jgi:hypothetical protein